MSAVAAQPARPGLWAGLFLGNTGVITALASTGALERPTPFILFALNLVLLIPLVRAARQWQEEKGAMSGALRRYNTRFLLAGAAYMAFMLVTAWLHNVTDQGSPMMWVLAVLPLIPVMGMIWTMISYLREEDDEFLRHRAVNAALVGLGLVLAVSTTWGFLEMFGLVPHVWAWAVFPLWAVGLAIGMAMNPLPGDDA